MRRTYSLLFICLLVFIPSASKAFSISPLRYLVTVDPGANSTVEIAVTNNEAKNMAFSASTLGMWQDTEGRPAFTKGIDNAEQWVEPMEKLFSLESGQSKKIEFAISAPADAPPGEHALGLAVEAKPLGRTGVAVGTRAIAILKLQVAGAANEKLVIREWRSFQNIYVGARQWNFSAILENQGNVSLSIQGNVAVKNWKDKTLAMLPLEVGSNLLVGAVRNVDASFDARPGGILWPGIYKVSARITYGQTRQTITGTTSIWYLPLWSIFASGLAILVILFLFVALRDKRGGKM